MRPGRLIAAGRKAKARAERQARAAPMVAAVAPTFSIWGRSMAYSWQDVQHLPHKVRNMVRRGYLLKVYNDKKILRGRVKTGHEIENDQLDIVHPVGYIAHVKPGEKTEVITLDVGGDSSRRIIIAVIGDREQHPQPDEGENWFYAPGDKKKFVRIKSG